MQAPYFAPSSLSHTSPREAVFCSLYFRQGYFLGTAVVRVSCLTQDFHLMKLTLMASYSYLIQQSAVFMLWGDCYAKGIEKADGALSHLIWWNVSLPMAEGWNQMSFKVPSKANHSLILWFLNDVPFLPSAKLGIIQNSPSVPSSGIIA